MPDSHTFIYEDPVKENSSTSKYAHTRWQRAMCGTSWDVHSFVPFIWLRQAEVFVQQMTFAPSYIPPSSQQHPPPSPWLPLLLSLSLSLLHADEKSGRGLQAANKQGEMSSMLSAGKNSTFSKEAQSSSFKMTTNHMERNILSIYVAAAEKKSVHHRCEVKREMW